MSLCVQKKLPLSSLTMGEIPHLHTIDLEPHYPSLRFLPFAVEDLG
jgi:hypothetical protein